MSMEHYGDILTRKWGKTVKTFFLFLAHALSIILTSASQNQLIRLDIASYGSQSEHEKMDVGYFGKQ